MKIKFILLLIIIINTKEVNSQPVEEWVQRYNGTANSFDLAAKMLIDNDNNILVYGSCNETGSLLDFLIIKYNPAGEIIWSKLYNGSSNSFDKINSACIDGSGNSYVTGYTTDSFFQTNITTAKIDSSGNLIWIKVFLKSGYSSGYGKDIMLDNSGNIVICGAVSESNGFTDIEVIKYSPAGAEIWNQTYNGDGNRNDVPVSINKDDSDNIIIAGTTALSPSNSDMIIINYDSSSSFKWKKTFGGNANQDDQMASMAVDADNNIYFCGSKFNNPGSYDYFYSKIDQSGNTIWANDYDGTGNSLDISSAIFLDSFCNVYITGFSRSDTNPGSEDILTIKITQGGMIQWIRNYNGIANGIDQANCITADKNGNIFLGGATDQGGANMVYALIKYDSLGNFQWIKNYFYSQTPEDFIYFVVRDKQDNLYVTGFNFGAATDFDIVTIKYSQTTGISNTISSIPHNFMLFQNYPNPFNPSTVISYHLSDDNFVSLIVYDVLGNKIKTLVNEKQSGGIHEILWDASGFPNGVYFYELKINTAKESDNFSSVKKMLLIK